MAPTDHREKPGMDRSFPASTKRRGQSLSGAELAGLGLFLAAAVVVPLVIGIGIDALTHTSPLFLFVGLVVGITLGILGGYLRLKPYL